LRSSGRLARDPERHELVARCAMCDVRGRPERAVAGRVTPEARLRRESVRGNALRDGLRTAGSSSRGAIALAREARIAGDDVRPSRRANATSAGPCSGVVPEDAEPRARRPGIRSTANVEVIGASAPSDGSHAGTRTRSDHRTPGSSSAPRPLQRGAARARLACHCRKERLFSLAHLRKRQLERWPIDVCALASDLLEKEIQEGVQWQRPGMRAHSRLNVKLAFVTDVRIVA
jgi:hypothetical protein